MCAAACLQRATKLVIRVVGRSASGQPSQPASLIGRAKSLFQSVFAAKPPGHYDQEIANAHAELLSVKKSENVLADVHTTLQKPLHELSRLEAGELRKLAHHAYYGIGPCAVGVDVASDTQQRLCRGRELWGGRFCTARQQCETEAGI